MLTRRSFGIMAGSILSVVWIPGVAAQSSGWICGTVDKGATNSEPFNLDVFSADAGFDRALLDAAVKEFKLTPFGTARFSDRWRRSEGMTPNTGVITLGVHFLNGERSEQERVRAAASQWLTGQLGQLMKFQFDVPRAQSQIVINLRSDRNNSFVGRDSAKYAQSQETMNLFNIIDHVIKHEFGHALGLNHEHQNPSARIRWKREVVLADMAKQGWDEKMCEDNIFSRFNSDWVCVGSSNFDEKSIMLYPIPSSWTEDEYSTGINQDLSKGDRDCISGLYRA